VSHAEIHLEAAAPSKPDFGAICNGCGACCALETCPLGRVVYRRIAGPCPGLRWDKAASRYFCILAEPGRWWHRLASRWISAGSGCDMSAEVER